MNVKSCSCRQCRHASPQRKRDEKKQARKKGRAVTRRALKNGAQDVPGNLSSDRWS